MHDEHAGGAELGRLLELVGPAAVVGHRLAAEDLRIQLVRIADRGDGRIVDEDDDRLALHVNAAEIIPLELGRLDAVSREDQLRVLEPHFVGDVFAEDDDFIANLERPGLSAPLHDDRSLRLRRQADERHFLRPGSVRIARLKSGGLELLDEVLDGQLLALRAGRAAFEFIR